MKMKLIKVKNYSEMSTKATDIVVSEIIKNPKTRIAFATGKTPKGLHKNLVGEYKKGKIDFSKIKAFNLDEYYPIKKNNKESFYYYLHKNLLSHVNIKKSNIILLNGETKNPEKECRNYEKKASKADLIILGIGVNGHIAFNEPGSALNSKTRLVSLNKNKKALTIGISTILSSKKIILLASGKKKAKAIRCFVKRKINSDCPASFLKKHRNSIVIVDKGAASLLG